MLAARERQAIKAMANSFGLRLSNFARNDIVSFQLTKTSRSPNSFFTRLNKAGFQYKTLETKGSSYSIKIWQKGQRPSGEDKTSKRRASVMQVLSKICILLADVPKPPIAQTQLSVERPPIPKTQLTFEIGDALARDKGYMEALLALRKAVTTNVEKEDLLKWVDSNISNLRKQIVTLERGFKKSTKTFKTPVTKK